MKMKTSKCKKCNATIRRNTKFCTQCGFELNPEKLHGPILSILTSNTSSVVFRIQKGRTTLGRHYENDIVLEDEEISNYHAALVVNEEQNWIEDLNSRNGIYLNGQKLKVRCRLPENALLKLGSTILRYESNQIKENEA